MSTKTKAPKKVMTARQTAIAYCGKIGEASKILDDFIGRKSLDLVKKLLEKDREAIKAENKGKKLSDVEEYINYRKFESAVYMRFNRKTNKSGSKSGNKSGSKSDNKSDTASEKSDVLKEHRTAINKLTVPDFIKYLHDEANNYNGSNGKANAKALYGEIATYFAKLAK